jgi:hypothetical protein
MRAGSDVEQGALEEGTCLFQALGWTTSYCKRVSLAAAGACPHHLIRPARQPHGTPMECEVAASSLTDKAAKARTGKYA